VNEEQRKILTRSPALLKLAIFCTWLYRCVDPNWVELEGSDDGCLRNREPQSVRPTENALQGRVSCAIRNISGIPSRKIGGVTRVDRRNGGCIQVLKQFNHPGVSDKSFESRGISCASYLMAYALPFSYGGSLSPGSLNSMVSCRPAAPRELAMNFERASFTRASRSSGSTGTKEPSRNFVSPWFNEMRIADPSAAKRNTTYQRSVALGEKRGL
jgi:hypothetical protein